MAAVIRALVLLFAAMVFAVGCGPKTLEQRQRHGEKLADEATGQLDRAEKELRALEPDEADEALRDATETLEEPDIVHSPESDLLKSRLQELRAQLPACREQRRLRDLDEKVRERRAKIGPVLQAMRDGMEALSTAKSVDEKRIDATEDAAKDLADLLEDTRELELRDEDFKSYMKRAHAELDKAKTDIRLAKARLEFQSGPERAKTDATEHAKQAKAQKNADERRRLYALASDEYARCATDAAKFAKELDKQAAALETTCRTGEAGAKAELKKLAPKPPAKKRKR